MIKSFSWTRWKENIDMMTSHYVQYPPIECKMKKMACLFLDIKHFHLCDNKYTKRLSLLWQASEQTSCRPFYLHPFRYGDMECVYLSNSPRRRHTFCCIYIVCAVRLGSLVLCRIHHAPFGQFSRNPFSFKTLSSLLLRIESDRLRGRKQRAKDTVRFCQELLVY